MPRDRRENDQRAGITRTDPKCRTADKTNRRDEVPGDTYK